MVVPLLNVDDGWMTAVMVDDAWRKCWHQNDEVEMDEGGMSGVKMRRRKRRRRRRRRRRRKRRRRRIITWDEQKR